MLGTLQQLGYLSGSGFQLLETAVLFSYSGECMTVLCTELLNTDNLQAALGFLATLTFCHV